VTERCRSNATGQTGAAWTFERVLSAGGACQQYGERAARSCFHEEIPHSLPPEDFDFFYRPGGGAPRRDRAAAGRSTAAASRAGGSVRFGEDLHVVDAVWNCLACPPCRFAARVASIELSKNRV